VLAIQPEIIIYRKFIEDSLSFFENAGIDFEKFEQRRIDVQYFGELMMMSNIAK
jgi:hypothetical protein